MMQMLTAGGMTALSDGEREADTDNPRGYLEWERIKQLPQEPECVAEAEGKVVKVISQLLLCLPLTHEYRVVFMQRPLEEVLRSQDEMLRRRGTFDASAEHKALIAAFQNHLYEVNLWLSGEARSHVKLLRVAYINVLNDAHATAAKVAEFVGGGLDLDAMVKQVDVGLYRNRKK